MSRRGDPVVFLDIDGPLRPYGCVPSDGAWVSERDGVCPVRMEMLNRLASVPGLKVVVSSSWRSDETTRDALVRQGLVIPFHPSWRTTLEVPDGNDVPFRGWQVRRWLAENGWRRHAIVDDSDDFLPRQAPRLVLVDPYVGIDREALTSMLGLLTGVRISKDRPSPSP